MTEQKNDEQMTPSHDDVIEDLTLSPDYDDDIIDLTDVIDSSDENKFSRDSLKTEQLPEEQDQIIELIEPVNNGKTFKRVDQIIHADEGNDDIIELTCTVTKPLRKQPNSISERRDGKTDDEEIIDLVDIVNNVAASAKLNDEESDEFDNDIIELTQVVNTLATDSDMDAPNREMSNDSDTFIDHLGIEIPPEKERPSFQLHKNNTAFDDRPRSSGTKTPKTPLQLVQSSTEKSKRRLENEETDPYNRTTPIAVTAEQLENALEKVVAKMLGEKIESILTEVIERSITKEIKRLKNMLLTGKTNPIPEND